MNASIIAVFNQFEILGTFDHAHPFGTGHINDTYLVKTKETHAPNYVLQRINHFIFPNVPALMNNVVLVTEHIQKKLRVNSQSNIERHCLTLIMSQTNCPYVQDTEGYYWACYLYIEGSKSLDLVANAKQAYEGGKMVGQFLDLLNDFPPALLHETLPAFHNVELRLNQFTETLNANSMNRRRNCADEIAFVHTHADQMQLILRLGKSGKIPLRSTHNDTKFNNILLDEQDNGLCVIDFDTVMPGYIHYDFSDAIRTVANTAVEDEKDLYKIDFNIDLFASFCRGFIGEVKHTLTSFERESLAASIPLMPFLMGLRFLTDYLAGDTYYKIQFSDHNLQRARAQFQFIRCIQRKMPKIESILNQIIQDCYSDAIIF